MYFKPVPKKFYKMMDADCADAPGIETEILFLSGRPQKKIAVKSPGAQGCPKYL